MESTNDLIKKAVVVLCDGGIVIYPTDTAYGIGCRIDDTKAVDRLFILRKRPMTQAMPILISSIDMALAYFDSPSDIVRHFMKIYWPGALTVIAPCKKNTVYAPLLGGGDTIGLRMPNHPSALALIEGAGVPIAGPSANFHGEKTPFLLKDLDPELVKLVDYVVPGSCTTKSVSTVVDCTVNPYRIVRQGAVKLV